MDFFSGTLSLRKYNIIEKPSLGRVLGAPLLKLTPTANTVSRICLLEASLELNPNNELKAVDVL